MAKHKDFYNRIYLLNINEKLCANSIYPIKVEKNLIIVKAWICLFNYGKKYIFITEWKDKKIKNKTLFKVSKETISKVLKVTGYAYNRQLRRVEKMLNSISHIVELKLLLTL